MIWHHPLRPLVWALLLVADRARAIRDPGPFDDIRYRKELPPRQEALDAMIAAEEAYRGRLDRALARAAEDWIFAEDALPPDAPRLELARREALDA